MYDLNKRSYFTTLGELRMLLAHLPADTVLGSYLHFEQDGSLVSFDDEDLTKEYSEQFSKNGADEDFWQGQDALMMHEHNDRLDYLAYMNSRIGG